MCVREREREFHENMIFRSISGFRPSFSWSRLQLTNLCNFILSHFPKFGRFGYKLVLVLYQHLKGEGFLALLSWLPQLHRSDQ